MKPKTHDVLLVLSAHEHLHFVKTKHKVGEGYVFDCIHTRMKVYIPKVIEGVIVLIFNEGGRGEKKNVVFLTNHTLTKFL